MPYLLKKTPSIIALIVKNHLSVNLQLPTMLAGGELLIANTISYQYTLTQTYIYAVGTHI